MLRALSIAMATFAVSALAGTTSSDLVGPGATSGAVVFDLYHGSLVNSLVSPPTDPEARWACGCDATPPVGLMYTTTFVLGECYVASAVSTQFTDYFDDMLQFRDAFNKTSRGVEGVDYWKKSRIGVKFNSCWPGVLASRTFYALNAAGTACDLTQPLQTDTLSMDRCDFASSMYVTGRMKDRCIQEKYTCFAAAP